MKPALTVRCVNLEAGLPSVDEARRRLAEVLRSARAGGVRVVKVIHGYGSSGVGGKLCPAVRASLKLRQKEGVIHGFIPGESFSVCDPATLRALTAYPELSGDADLDRTNEGITIVLLSE